MLFCFLLFSAHGLFVERTPRGAGSAPGHGHVDAGDAPHTSTGHVDWDELYDVETPDGAAASSGVNHAPPWTDMLDEWRRRMDGWTYNPLADTSRPPPWMDEEPIGWQYVGSPDDVRLGPGKYKGSSIEMAQLSPPGSPQGGSAATSNRQELDDEGWLLENIPRAANEAASADDLPWEHYEETAAPHAATSSKRSVFGKLRRLVGKAKDAAAAVGSYIHHKRPRTAEDQAEAMRVLKAWEQRLFDAILLPAVAHPLIADEQVEAIANERRILVRLRRLALLGRERFDGKEGHSYFALLSLQLQTCKKSDLVSCAAALVALDWLEQTPGKDLFENRCNGFAKEGGGLNASNQVAKEGAALYKLLCARANFILELPDLPLPEEESKLLDDVPKTDVTVMDAFLHYYRGRHLAKERAHAGEVDASGAVTEAKRKPKVVLFTCSFGGGHKAAAKAVESYLRDGYEVKVVDTSSLTGFSKGSLLMKASLTVFNDYFIKKKLYKISNAIDSVTKAFYMKLPGPCPSPTCNSERKNRYRAILLEERPDLIVTVFHMELLATLEVAVDLGNLPLLHLATDIDIKMKEVFPLEEPLYPRFAVGLPFRLQESYKTLAPLEAPGVPSSVTATSRSFVSGYPVRQAFLAPTNFVVVSDMRKNYLGDDSSPVTGLGVVILVMSGGAGQLVYWPEKISRHGIPSVPGRIHIVVVAGGENKYVERYNELYGPRIEDPPYVMGDGAQGRYVWDTKSHGVTVEIATDEENTNAEKPFYLQANRLAALMDAADVIVTKPGGSTTAEIAYRGTPAVYDASSGLFEWEEFGVEILERHGRGVALRSSKGAAAVKTIAAALLLGRNASISFDERDAKLDTGARVRARAAELLALPATCAYPAALGLPSSGCQVVRGDPSFALPPGGRRGTGVEASAPGDFAGDFDFLG